MTDSIRNDSELWLAKAKIFVDNKQIGETSLFFEQAMKKIQLQNQWFRLKKSIETYLSFVKAENILAKNVQYWETVSTALPVVQLLQLQQ